MTYIPRQTTDDNFEHCAKALLPFAVFNVSQLEKWNIRLRDPYFPDAAIPEWDGVKVSDVLNAIMICAEVAMAFSVERYGKMKIRVPCGREVVS